MKILLTKDEVLADKKRTEDDVQRLAAICTNLELFINDTDENRSNYRIDLMRFDLLRSQAQRLLTKIDLTLAELQ